MFGNRMPSTAMPRMKSSATIRSSPPRGWSGVPAASARSGSGSTGAVALEFMPCPFRARPYAASAIGHKAVLARLLERSTSGIGGGARGETAGLELGDAAGRDHQPLRAGQLGPPAQALPQRLGI